jgi:hypothetical protein
MAVTGNQSVLTILPGDLSPSSDHRVKTMFLFRAPGKLIKALQAAQQLSHQA